MRLVCKSWRLWVRGLAVRLRPFSDVDQQSAQILLANSSIVEIPPMESKEEEEALNGLAISLSPQLPAQEIVWRIAPGSNLGVIAKRLGELGSVNTLSMVAKVESYQRLPFVDPGVAPALQNGFARLTTLRVTSFDLRKNDIDAICARMATSPGGLQSLSLVQCSVPLNLTATLLEAVSKSSTLTELTVLPLETLICAGPGGPREEERFPQLLSQAVALVSLNVASLFHSFYSEGFSVLRSLTRLTSLTGGFDGPTLAAAADSLPKLKELELKDTLEAAEADALAKLLERSTAIESLSFKGPVGAVCRSLAVCPLIRRLKLNLRSEDAAPLAQFLRSPSCLVKTLVLKEAEMYAVEESPFTEISRALRENSTVQYLEFPSMAMYPLEFLTCLAASLRSASRSVHLSINVRGTGPKPVKQFMEHLRLSLSLSSLDLEHNHGFMTEELANLLSAEGNRIATLTCTGKYIQQTIKNGAGPIANALALNTNLSSLTLRGEKLDKQACVSFAEVLKQNVTLRELDLSGCRGTPDLELVSAAHQNSSAISVQLPKVEVSALKERKENVVARPAKIAKPEIVTTSKKAAAKKSSKRK